MKPRISISPSLLETFRLAMSGAPFATPDRIRQGVLGAFTANEATSKGKAYHKLIEDGPEAYRVSDDDPFTRTMPQTAEEAQDAYDLEGSAYYQVYEEELDRDWAFTVEQIQPALHIRKSHPNMVYEVWNDVSLDVWGYDIRFRMRHDGVEDLTVYDFKTTSRKKSWIDYAPSMQWHLAMLALPEAQKFTYYTIQFMAKHTRLTKQTFPRHDGIKDEVVANTIQFIRWLEVANPELIRYLEIDTDGNRVIPYGSEERTKMIHDATKIENG